MLHAMSTTSSRGDALAAVLVAVATLAGVLAWAQLPDQMAIHFTASGTPDSHVSKLTGVLLVPAIMVVAYAAVRGAFLVDGPRDPRTATTTVVATLGLCAALQLFVVGWNLGYRLPSEVLLGGVALWAVGLVWYVRRREGAWVPS